MRFRNLSPLAFVADVQQARVNVIDARRISDDMLVYIKKLKTDSEELALMRYLSSPEMLEHPHNHCVPLLDVIHDPADSETCFVVMPFLRYIDSPAVELVEDMLECGEQILEVSSESFIPLPVRRPVLSMNNFRVSSSYTTTAWPIGTSVQRSPEIIRSLIGHLLATARTRTS